jgi:hypothetical protein
LSPATRELVTGPCKGAGSPTGRDALWAYVHRSGRHSDVAATTVLLVGRIHVDLLRVCTACCPGC